LEEIADDFIEETLLAVGMFDAMLLVICGVEERMLVTGSFEEMMLETGVSEEMMLVTATFEVLATAPTPTQYEDPSQKLVRQSSETSGFHLIKSACVIPYFVSTAAHPPSPSTV
jgi:hypothetical protein